MSDIVERLRAERVVVHNPDDPMNSFSEVRQPTPEELEAADEIERLRADNARMREALEEITDVALGDAHAIATAALEPEGR